MIDTFDLWEKACGELNIHQGGMIKPNRQFIHWVNDISVQLAEEKFSGAWQKNQKISDDLSNPFLISKVLKVTGGGASFDLIPFPDDYAHISSCRFFVKEERAFAEEIKCEKKGDQFVYDIPPDVFERDVTIVPNNRWSGVSKHKGSKKPSLNRPYITQFEGGFKIMPKGISYVVMDYFRKPKPATFSYTLGADDQIIYDKNNSQPLEWSSLVINEFIARLGVKYGKFTREGFIYQTSDKEKATGV